MGFSAANPAANSLSHRGIIITVMRHITATRHAKYQDAALIITATRHAYNRDAARHVATNAIDPAFSSLSLQQPENLRPNIGTPPYPSLHH